MYVLNWSVQINLILSPFFHSSMLKMKKQRKPMNKYQQDGQFQLHFGSGEVVVLVPITSLDDTRSGVSLIDWINRNKEFLIHALKKNKEQLLNEIVLIRFKPFGMRLDVIFKDGVQEGKDSNHFSKLKIRVLCPNDVLPTIDCGFGSPVQITYEDLVANMFGLYIQNHGKDQVEVTYDATDGNVNASFVGSTIDTIEGDVRRMFENSHLLSQQGSIMTPVRPSEVSLPVPVPASFDVQGRSEGGDDLPVALHDPQGMQPQDNQSDYLDMISTVPSRRPLSAPLPQEIGSASDPRGRSLFMTKDGPSAPFERSASTVQGDLSHSLRTEVGKMGRAGHDLRGRSLLMTKDGPSAPFERSASTVRGDLSHSSRTEMGKTGRAGQYLPGRSTFTPSRMTEYDRAKRERKARTLQMAGRNPCNCSL